MQLTDINNIKPLFLGADPMSFKQIFSGLQVRVTQQIQEEPSEVCSFTSHVSTLSARLLGLASLRLTKLKLK